MKTFNPAHLLGFTSIFFSLSPIISAQAPPPEEPVTVPHVFQAGEPVSAAEMNENFQFLFDVNEAQQLEIEALQTSQETMQTSQATLQTSQAILQTSQASLEESQASTSIIIASLLARVTELEQNATKLFKGNNVQNIYEIVSSQTVLDAEVGDGIDAGTVNTYVAKGRLILNSNNTWSLSLSEQEHQLSQIGSAYIDVPEGGGPEYVSLMSFAVQAVPSPSSQTGTWSLIGDTLTLISGGVNVVTFKKSIGGDMLISPNASIRDEGERRSAAAGSVVAIKVAESPLLLP